MVIKNTAFCEVFKRLSENCLLQNKTAARLWRAFWCVKHTRTNCAKHAYIEWRDLALLIFAMASASMEGKSKCAKLGIAKTGFQNPKKRGRRVKTKNRLKFPKLFL